MKFAALALLTLFLAAKYLFATSDQFMIDFTSFYCAGLRYWAQGLNPYDLDAQVACAHSLGQLETPFIYSPSFLMLIFPLPWLSHTLASALMLAANLGILMYLLYFLRDKNPWLLLTIAASSAVVHNIQVGQINLLVFFLSLTAANALQKTDNILAGIALALVALLKIVFLPMIALAFLFRRWHALITAITLYIIVWIYAALTLPQDVWNLYATKVAYALKPFHPNFYLRDWVLDYNLSLWGVLARLNADPIIGYILSALIAIITGLVILKQKQPVDHLKWFGILWSLTLIISPITWDVYLLGLVIPLMRTPLEKPVWFLAFMLISIMGYLLETLEGPYLANIGAALILGIFAYLLKTEWNHSKGACKAG